MHANLDPSNLNQQVISCTRCPRLRDYCRKIALEKKAAFRDWEYWGRPVPNFWPSPPPDTTLTTSRDREGAASLLAAPPSGGVGARPGGTRIFGGTGVSPVNILLVGLAPAAHGGNRTGRMFTGDRSGDFLYAALHEVGLATQPTSKHPGDGLALRHCAITAAAHCAPPGNRPTREELENCLPWLDETFRQLPGVKSVVCLGQVAFDQTIKLYRRRNWLTSRSALKFSHAAEFPFPAAPTVLCSYHPSQQNTFTGKLTMPMLVAVLSRALTRAAAQSRT